MSASTRARNKEVASFRTRLFTAMMVIVATPDCAGSLSRTAQSHGRRGAKFAAEFQTELSSLHKIEELRHAALADRCNALVAKPRIHAAIEDNAIDLLYPSAKDELRDLMEGEEPPPEQAARSLQARFYRFLDDTGAVMKPPNPSDVGELDAATEAQLSLEKLPDTQQIGYIQEMPAEMMRGCGSNGRADFFDRDGGCYFGPRDRVQAIRARKQTATARDEKWHLGKWPIASAGASAIRAEISLSENNANVVRQCLIAEQNNFRVEVAWCAAAVVL